MLVLTRQKNQSIMIGDDIEIVLVDIRGDKVRLGINAPHEIPVHRKEVYENIKAANIEAAAASLDEAARIAELLQSQMGKKKKKEPGNEGPDKHKEV